MAGRREQGLTLIEWILGASAALTLLALAVPAYVRSKRHQGLLDCRARLQAMHAAQAVAPKDPAALGFSYWTRLTKTQPPLLEASTLRCPFVAAGVARACDYLGPRTDPGPLAGTEPIGCDNDENHGEHGRMGGNVLYKSGEVKTLHPREGGVEDPWREAFQRKCGP